MHEVALRSVRRVLRRRVLPALLLLAIVGGCAPDGPDQTATGSAREGVAVLPAATTPPDSSESPADSTGAVRWSYPLAGGFLNTARPVVDVAAGGGRAFVAADSLLRCVLLRTGRPCWRTALGNTRSLGTRALVEGDSLLFLNHFGTVSAFSKATGRQRWRTVIPDFEGVDLQQMGANATHLAVGGHGAVVRLRKQSGRADLRLHLDSTAAGVRPRVFAPALAEDGTLYVPTFSRPPGGARFEGDLRAYAPDGTLRWRHALTGRTRTLAGSGRTYTAGTGVHGCAVAGGRVFFSTGQAVHAVDRHTGEKVWKRFFPDSGFGVGPTVAGRHVFIGATTGAVFALRQEDGRVDWRASVEGGILAPAVAAGGFLFQIDDGFGALWVFDRATGRARWHGTAPGHARDRELTYRTPPAVGGGTMVVVGSKRVYGLVAPKAAGDERRTGG